MRPDQDISIELLAHQEFPRFQEFIKDHWEKDHLFVKETSIFDWQHKGPHDYHYMVAKQGKAIIGVQGIIPQSQFDSQLPKTQIFLTLWKVLENRGVGIGLRLYKNILKEYMPEFIAGIGMNPRLVLFHKWQGFKVGKMDHHVFLSPYVVDFKIARVPKMPKPQLKKKKPLISFQKITKRQLQNLDTKELYLHQLPLKSDIYIQNRYMNHPVYKYEVYSISKDNKLQALCIIRPVFKDNLVVLRFVDFMGPNEAFALLYDFVVSLLKTYNAEYMDLYSYGIPSTLIQEAGFINREKIKGLIIPNYFEPFERKNVDIIFDYKSSQAHYPVRLFKADSDQDRPNQV